MDVVGQTRIVVKLAFDILVLQYHVQHDAIVPETVLLRRHNVGG